MINPIVITLALAFMAFAVPCIAGKKLALDTFLMFLSFGLLMLTATLVLMIFFVPPVP